MTDSKENLEALRDTVLLKTGKNIYNFQQIEKILKFLISKTSVSGYVSELESNLQKKTEATHTLGMGHLVGQLMDAIYITPEQVKEWSEKPASNDELKETRISHYFNIETTAEFIEQRKQELKSLVNERNHLVHHLFSDKNIHDIEHLLEMEEYLDCQRERIAKEYEFLVGIVRQFHDYYKELEEWLKTEDGERQLKLAFLKVQDVIQYFLDYASEHARSDGWTVFQKPCNELARNYPKELEKFDKNFGFKKLKDALDASELFEFAEEKTNKGKRLLYRATTESQHQA